MCKANFNNIAAISLREQMLVLTYTPTRALEDVLLQGKYMCPWLF